MQKKKKRHLYKFDLKKFFQSSLDETIFTKGGWKFPQPSLKNDTFSFACKNHISSPRDSSIGCELHLMKRKSQIRISPPPTFTWTCQKKKKQSYFFFIIKFKEIILIMHVRSSCYLLKKTDNKHNFSCCI
jgi:hypothetical protein